METWFSPAFFIMAEKKSTDKKTSSQKRPGTKRRTKRKSPKPKVRLSQRKVYALSMVIVLLCAASLALSVILASPDSPAPAAVKTEQQKKPEKKTESVRPKAAAPLTTKKTNTESTSRGTSSATSSATSSKETSSAAASSTKAQSTPSAATSVSSSTKTSSTPSSTDAYPQIIPAVNGATLTFVFDDGGHNIAQLEKFLALPFPVDIAVLPCLPHSAECGRLVRQSGKHQLMLHQPMQALNLKVNPGEGAILPGMHVQEIMELLRKNIAEIGPVAGLNNHEGSAICENEIQIGAVLDEAKAQGIFFLDSRTTSQTRAPQAALERGMTLYERDIFLDNEKTRENILKELYKGLTIANKKGRAILIGHVWSADILPAVLTEVYPELVKKGYRFSVVR